jgi:putative oxidoreductase
MDSDYNTITPSGGKTMSRLARLSDYWAAVIIRLMVGLVFLSEGIQTFLFPQSLGVARFDKLGIPWPQTVAPGVGGAEIFFGVMILIGFMTRIVTVPLLAIIAITIATVKYPIFIEKGIWQSLHESRIDYCMIMGLLYLALNGPGPLSLDFFRRK